MKRGELEPSPRFSLLLHLLNTLAFYSALDSSLLYVNKINWFFVHFPSFFVGLIPIKTRNKLCPASGGTAFYHFSKKTLAVWKWFFQLMAHFQAFFSPWGLSWKRSRPSVFSPRCFILQAFQHAFEFFILGKSSEVMLAADPILICQNMRSSDVIFRRLIDWQNFK